MTQCIAACVQLNAQDNILANLELAETLVREAAAQGAELISLPENAFFMRDGETVPLPIFDTAAERFCALAQELGCWILIGSIHPPSSTVKKAWNRSLLINDQGEILAQYDKIHLFDATLKNGESYRESDRLAPGDNAVVAQTPWGGVGMSICYDLRFPHLFRAMAKRGAKILSIPAAFTYTTGVAHWHTLLRARAIENGCFVIAPGQCGIHPGNRRTYGHSLIIDPWGTILAEASEESVGFITATLDMDRVAEVRGMIPSLEHDRAFDF